MAHDSRSRTAVASVWSRPATGVANRHNPLSTPTAMFMRDLRPLPLAFACTLLAACASLPAARDTAPSASPGLSVAVPDIRHPDGETPAWWFRAGAAQAAERGAMSGRAKNVILFVGDGMSLSTVAAARILEGQRHHQSGEENRLSWENFPYTGLSKTYNTDSQTPDSAGTMSAMATGVKTNAGAISVAQQPPKQKGDCKLALQGPLLTLWELAESAGMSTGVVTTTRLTHATPAATFSHSASRNWEHDAPENDKYVGMPDARQAEGCQDIARQMIDTPFGSGPEVLMGGGRSGFITVAQADPEDKGKTGARRDKPDNDLVSRWQRRHPQGRYVWNAQELADAPLDQPLLGLFERSHMEFEHDRPTDKGGEPTLAEMTRAAIARLQRGPNGYVLLVEGGRIDHAHHNGNAYRALTDTIALSDAVRAAAEMTSDGDTLILVTADHSHTLSFVGYPSRGNAILGKVHGTSGEESEGGEYALDASKQPYTTLNYANGPGYRDPTARVQECERQIAAAPEGAKPKCGLRPDLTTVDTEAPDFLQESIFPLSLESHGGDDVGIWARGPGSSAVRGSLEQNAIFHIMLQATPKLRARLCAEKLCDANGVPVELPDPAAFKTK